ncbi:thioredoxin family protein [Telmatocola sphagniphila]|uniref:Thioredoxin family protein n=1 Tax=Telmatocola sphagniphila TaxID=1123043 RepID=A0A8E6B939_9BACT|nr:thioredoxin family protein [Telmatocola sphagniphila]QVL33564.1 thioredoxin family protein [Telmatocola sphagniphila]
MHRLLTALLVPLAVILISSYSVTLSAQTPANPPAAEKKSPDVEELLSKLESSFGQKTKGREFYQAYSQLTALVQGKEKSTAEKASEAILAKLKTLLPEGAARKELETSQKSKTQLVAAERGLEILRALHTVKSIGRGKIAFGTLKVEDSKLNPEMVLAQMVIFEDGWFVTDIGDSKKTLGFRAAGYLPLDAKLPETCDELQLDTLILKPISLADSATITGKIVFDGPDGMKNLKANLNLTVPPPNTATGGYSPRKKWPEATSLTVGKDGGFELTGLTPGDYFLYLQTGKHEDVSKKVTLKPASTEDLGKLTMRSTDMGYYLKKETPKAGKFPWQKDIEEARKRALAEGKPMMIMMTATWCGPCKLLEEKTLNDPWVQQFLKEFVVVKAYEDKEVEKLYNGNAYPTLVFTDKTGKELHRTLGYQPPGTFSGNIFKACQELGLKIDPDLQTLVDQKIIKLPKSGKAVSIQN